MGFKSAAQLLDYAGNWLAVRVDKKGNLDFLSGEKILPVKGGWDLVQVGGIKQWGQGFHIERGDRLRLQRLVEIWDGGSVNLEADVLATRVGPSRGRFDVRLELLGPFQTVVRGMAPPRG